jgi:hypothetical protein
VKKRNAKPSTSKFSVLRQLCNLIPPHLVSKLARETGVASVARTFSPWSHIVSMLFAQLTHAICLNDVCDALRLFSGPLSALRGASAPSRNNLSHANKHRDAALAELLFWSVLDHLQLNGYRTPKEKHATPLRERLSSIDWVKFATAPSKINVIEPAG